MARLAAKLLQGLTAVKPPGANYTLLLLLLQLASPQLLSLLLR
jgi:hypothetical protein